MMTPQSLPILESSKKNLEYEKSSKTSCRLFYWRNQPIRKPWNGWLETLYP